MLTEVMEGSYKDITREGTTEDLSFETSHFTTFAAVFAVAPIYLMYLILLMNMD